MAVRMLVAMLQLTHSSRPGRLLLPLHLPLLLAAVLPLVAALRLLLMLCPGCECAEVQPLPVGCLPSESR
jgi:hypothetical protein